VRDWLADIPVGTRALRSVRYMTDDDFADITDDELEAAARWLRAAAFSAREGARRIDGVLRARGWTAT
jgi:hypothetical protein